MLISLAKTSEIIKVKKSKFIEFDNIRLYYLYSNQLRICVSISKAFGNAVHRNKLRRRIKNILYLMHLNIKYDLLIQVRSKFVYDYNYIYHILLASIGRINK